MGSYGIPWDRWWLSWLADSKNLTPTLTPGMTSMAIVFFHEVIQHFAPECLQILFTVCLTLTLSYFSLSYLRSCGIPACSLLSDTTSRKRDLCLQDILVAAIAHFIVYIILLFVIILLPPYAVFWMSMAFLGLFWIVPGGFGSLPLQDNLKR